MDMATEIYMRRLGEKETQGDFMIVRESKRVCVCKKEGGRERGN